MRKKSMRRNSRICGIVEIKIQELLQVFSSRQDRYVIYQIRDDGQGRKYLFMGTEYLKKQGFSVEYDDYQMVYSDVPGENETLDSLYEKFNIRRPLDFTGHSLSVSDVIALKKDGEITAHYVDSFGYTELPEFFSQKEKDIEQEKETAQESRPQGSKNGDINKPYEKVYPSLYTHTIKEGRLAKIGRDRSGNAINICCSLPEKPDNVVRCTLNMNLRIRFWRYGYEWM